MAATGAKWSKDDSRFGVKLMQKAGWEAGKGLGRNEDGIVEHVKTTRKDNVLGIGYEGQVKQTWSAQSVGFADILERMNSQSPTAQSEDEDRASPVSKTPAAGKHGSAYTKRRALKTEALRSEEGKSEVLGAASSLRKRNREEDDDEPVDVSTLVSSTLKRLMDRCPKHEPRPSATTDSSVVVTKPDPRPPRPAVTPFYN